jgi:multidrug efflux pump subunit AcrA (membrane-fusion protein)
VARQDKNSLFRREALARLDDIDELDRLVTVTHPRAWLTLGAVAALIITALIWASVGRLATTVSGDGILLAGNYVMRVTTVEGGQLESLDATLGQQVSAGDTVATVLSSPSGSAPATHGAVVSPYTGKVVSLQAYPGQYVAPGAPLLTIEPSGVPLTATLYLPVDTGKKIRRGQEVQVMPANANVDQYGFIPARVTFVADLPSTPESMQAVLQNDFLVQQFAAGGPAIRVEARLQPDPTTVSGYAWSSSDGPAMKISAGTTCSARIILERSAPITYAFPALKRVLGGAK